MNKVNLTIPRTDEDFKFDVDTMGDMLEEAFLSNRKVEEEWQRKTFPPSGIGYGSGTCPRRWYYEFNHEVLRDPDWQPLAIANMDYGTDEGERIAEAFERAGILVEAERVAKSEDPPISGKIDVVLDWQGKKTIGEVKTTKQEPFTLIRASGKARMYQQIQLLLYMWIEQAEQGFMLYQNKNTSEIVIIPVYMDEENTQTLENVLAWLRKVGANTELPERPFTKSSVACKSCPLAKHCWEDETEATVEIDPLVVPD